ncbi:MAG: DUF2029 domain-containing protein [Armatimonadetes bacterium]|nr:DUF2029 domain-containing protein [Anaerolineae bacterium]
MSTLLPTFALDPGGIPRRLRRRLTPWALFALLLPLGMAGVFAYLDATAEIGAFPDYRTFIATAEGIFGSSTGGFFYMHWVRPVFVLLHVLPLHIGYLLWAALNIGGVWWAARCFNGRPTLVLLSYQLFFVVYYGNIAGVIVGALAVMWWGLNRPSTIRWRPLLIGVAWATACIKPQAGVPLGAALLLLAEVDWRTRLWAGWVVLLVIAVSLVVYPGWVEVLYNTLRQTPPDVRGNISLWQWLGAPVLLLWLPVIFALRRRPAPGVALALVSAALALTSPYFQQTDLLALMVLPIGGLALVGNVGWAFLVVGWAALKWTVIAPLLIYTWALWHSLRPGRISTG